MHDAGASLLGIGGQNLIGQTRCIIKIQLLGEFSVKKSTVSQRLVMALDDVRNLQFD